MLVYICFIVFSFEKLRTILTKSSFGLVVCKRFCIVSAIYSSELEKSEAVLSSYHCSFLEMPKFAPCRFCLGFLMMYCDVHVLKLLVKTIMPKK